MVNNVIETNPLVCLPKLIFSIEWSPSQTLINLFSSLLYTNSLFLFQASSGPTFYIYGETEEFGSFRGGSETIPTIVGRRMLNNGHGGIGTPDGSHQGGHPMFGGGHPGQVEYKYDPTGGPVEYKFDPSKGQVDYKYDPSKGPVEFKYDPSANPNNAYLGGPSPPGMNGIGGGAHHSGGYCSQMSVNQNIQCPPNTKVNGI